MPRCSRSTRLEHLALRAFGDHVTLLLQNECYSELRYLRTILLKTVPTRLVNDIVSYLLNCLDNIHYRWINKPLSRSAIQDFIDAILHPALSKLECPFAWSHYIYRKLWTLRKIRVLKLQVCNTEDEKFILAALEIMEDLETFHLLWVCNDNILKQLCETCSRIKCLDISGSPNVTDVSVEFILKQNHLEELDTFGTSVSTSGYEMLVNSLPKQLKKFGCNEIDTSLLFDKFPNLTSLRLGVTHCVVTKIFDNILCLSLHCSEFSNVIEIIGSQLLELQLSNCKHVDICYIAAKCRVLESFKLFSCSYAAKTHLVLNSCPPGFHKLQYLTLDKFSKYPACSNIDKLVVHYILSHASDIKIIYIESYAGFDKDFLATVLQTNKLIDLEEFSLHEIYSEIFSLQNARYLLEHCSNLRLLSLSGGARQGENVKTFLMETNKRFPEVKVKVVITQC